MFLSTFYLFPLEQRSEAESKRRSNRNNSAEQKKSPNILMTQVDPVASKQFVSIIKKLGGFLIDTPQIGDILICDKVYRSYKFLFALCKGIPIVRSKWLEASLKNGAFEPTEPFLLADYEAEKRFNFSLKQSLGKYEVGHYEPSSFSLLLCMCINFTTVVLFDKFAETARKIKLFDNCQVFATPNVQPVPDEIAEIVQYCGGEYFYTLPKKLKQSAKIVLFSHIKDKKLWQKYQSAFPKIEIVGCEGFMQSVMKQRISFFNHLITS